MIEWPCNRVDNDSSYTLLVAFSSGGSVFDAGVWTVKMLKPGKWVDDHDIDYLAAYRPDLAINGQLGWWKLFQGAPYTVIDAPTGKGLKLKGFWPRKSFKNKSEAEYDKEWRSLIDKTDTDFGNDPEDKDWTQ